MNLNYIRHLRSVATIFLALLTIIWVRSAENPAIEKGQDKSAVVQADKPFIAHFTSGEGKEKGRQSFELRLPGPGKFVLTFENANSSYSDHWLIWDGIALKRQRDGRAIWSVGNDDVGSSGDYSEKAFAEFAKKGTPGSSTRYIVGASKDTQFVRELNDNDVRSAEVHFELSAEDIEAKPILVLSTLYSSHAGTPDGFRMRITVKRVGAQ